MILLIALKVWHINVNLYVYNVNLTRNYMSYATVLIVLNVGNVAMLRNVYSVFQDNNK